MPLDYIQYYKGQALILVMINWPKRRIFPVDPNAARVIVRANRKAYRFYRDILYLSQDIFTSILNHNRKNKYINVNTNTNVIQLKPENGNQLTLFDDYYWNKFKLLPQCTPFGHKWYTVQNINN